MPPSEVEKIFQAFAEKRKAELPRFTPDGIPITLENKFDDAIYNYLYEYWKTNSGEYDPKKDVIPESEMNKMHPKTKNEKKFEQWLLQQYGMTNKEQREYTLKGNLESLWEIFSAADMVLFARGLPSIGKELAQLGKKAVDDVAEEAIEKTVKKEAAEEMAESTAKKEVADTAEDLSQKTVDKDDSSVIKGGSETGESLWKPTEKKNNLWNKGKLKIHYDKHGGEFGAKSSQEYSNMAVEFGTRNSDDIIQTIHEGYVYKYEPSTNTIFVGTEKGGKIKTFYVWDGREDDVVINTLKGLGLIS